MNGLQWGMVKVKWHWTYFNILRTLHWKPRVVTMSYSSSLVVPRAVNLQCHQRWQSCHHNYSIFGVCHLICIWYISSSMHTALFRLFFWSYYVKNIYLYQYICMYFPNHCLPHCVYRARYTYIYFPSYYFHMASLDDSHPNKNRLPRTGWE